MYVEEILINRNLKNLDISTFTGTKGLIFLISRITFLIQVFHYAVNGIKLANKHNEHIENYYSNTEGRTLNWVKTINWVILMIALSSVTFTFIGRGFFSKNEELLLIPSAIFSTLIFIIGFKGNQCRKTTVEFESDIDEFLAKNVKIDQTDFLKYKLIQLFEKDKIFLHPDLKITHLSEKLQTNRTYISKLINDEMNMNFNEFVNNYRVDEAKKLMKTENGKIITLEIIAEKSGFGSFNSFNRVFKLITGITPGKYRDKTETTRLSE
jgi:AraC-like DNA-binding protein